MLTRQQLQIINKRTLKYPLHIAEKDYFLALVLKLLAASSLGEKLVFKGGTALHHCYLDQTRFSEDLDFSSNQQPVSLDEVRQVLASEPYLEIKKDYQSDATIKIERLSYTGPLGHPNSIKVEIDYRQNVLLPPQLSPYYNVWGLKFSAQVMDRREICAEKIRATSERARYRDFYDLYLLLDSYTIDLNEVVSCIEQKEIRGTISVANILTNWKVVSAQKGTEMQRVYYARPVKDQEIEAMIRGLPLGVIR